MYWHLELILEFTLLVILWRKPAPRWFSILIGCDFAANLLQLALYRPGYRGISRVVWECGIVLAAPLGALALIEASTRSSTRILLDRSANWHLRLLAAWLAGRLCIISLQTQPALTIPLNHALLTLDAAAFVAWAWLFVL